MKVICLLLVIIVFQCNLKAQLRNLIYYDKDSIGGNQQEDLVYTPFGPAKKSNVHFIDNNHHININNNHVQVVNAKTGIISHEFESVLKKNTNGNEGGLISNLNNQYNNDGYEFNDGWITYALFQYIGVVKPITFFSTSYVVPAFPLKSSNQILYLFNALFTIENGESYIVQPVLQWRETPAGGGKYWAICNWLVTNKDIFYDSLIKVNPGTILQGEIKLTASSDTLFSYSSSFLGYPTSLQINNIPKLTDAYEALEGYFITECNEYPIDEKLRMYNIKVESDNISTPSRWWPNDRVIGCGQFTKILNQSVSNGEVDIHFHKPVSIDNFDDIHFYPNPVGDQLHISPNTIKNVTPTEPDEPIKDCDLTIYNNLGVLVKSFLFEKLDYEFNIDMKDLKAGLYVIKFSYGNNIHAFKIIKK